MGDHDERRILSQDSDRNDLDCILSALDRGPGISELELAKLVEFVAAHYETPLPPDYLDFLRASDGADGTFENGMPIVLWAAELLPSVNADLRVEEEMPGCLVIGSDAGDLLYGIDLRADAPERYVETEDAAMAWDYLLWTGTSFEELVRRVAAQVENEAPGRGWGAALARFFRRERRGADV